MQPVVEDDARRKTATTNAAIGKTFRSALGMFLGMFYVLCGCLTLRMYVTLKYIPGTWYALIIWRTYRNKDIGRNNIIFPHS